MNIIDFYKIELSHRLSEYEIMLPNWRGDLSILKPYSNWSKDHRLSWYDAYNASKHDRHDKAEMASFEALMNAYAALAALISAQFLYHDFSRRSGALLVESVDDGFDDTVGAYFRVRYPIFRDDERYGFTSATLKQLEEPFADFPYPPP